MVIDEEQIIDDLPLEEQVSLLDFLGELKHLHVGKPIHLDASLFSSNEESDNDADGDVSVSELGIADFLVDLKERKSEVSKLVMTNPSPDDKNELVVKWRSRPLITDDGPEPPKYIPSPPPKKDNFLESLLKGSSHKNKAADLNSSGRSLSEKVKRSTLEKKPKAKFTRSPNGPLIVKRRSSSPTGDVDITELSLSNRPARKPLPRPPSLLLSQKSSSPKFNLSEKPITSSNSDSPPLSPTTLSGSPPPVKGEASSGETPIADKEIHIPLSPISPLASPVKGIFQDAKEVGGEGKDISVKKGKVEEAMDLLEFLTEIKNTSTLLRERRSTIFLAKEKRFDDLPQSIKQKSKDLNLDRETIEKHMDLFWRIAYFLYREDFPPVPAPLGGAPAANKDREIYASELVLEHGKSEIKLPPKALKKLFKGGNLTGEGGYGKVFVSRDTNRKDSVAIKKVSHITPKNKDTNFSEVGFLSSCTHPNIVSFFAAYLNVNPKKGIEEVWIITEYLHGGTLAEAAKNYEFKEKHVRYIAKEILQALAYLHNKGWAHRDLKSPNIMISLDGQIKLIDFGLCADMTQGERIKLLGSAFWIPPEMINRQPHHLSADIWSFGVCLLELFIRGPPFAYSALFCMFTVALVGLQSLIPPQLSGPCKDFLQQCLTTDPSKRPSSKQLLEHEWLKQPTISRADLALTTRSIFMAQAIDALLV